MEFSRYTTPPHPAQSLMIAVSNGGKVSRTIEAIRRAKSLGMPVIAATGEPDQPVATEADLAILGALPNVRAMLTTLDRRLADDALNIDINRAAEPGAAHAIAAQLGITQLDLLMIGLGAFQSSLILCYLIALHISTLRLPEHTTESAAHQLPTFSYLDTITQVATEALTNTVEANNKRILDLATALGNRPAYIYIGAGPSHASAMFSAAKILEQPQQIAIAAQLEEWAHTYYFTIRPGGIPVFLIAPPGPSRDRAIEQARAIRAIGGTSIAIAHADDDEFAAHCDYTIPVFSRADTTDILSPLVYTVPAQMFAFALLQLKGQVPLQPPYDFKTLMSVNHQNIYHSTIHETA